MEIIKIDALSELDLTAYYTTSVIEKEEDAIKWAETFKADTLYYFELGKLYIVEAA